MSFRRCNLLAAVLLFVFAFAGANIPDNAAAQGSGGKWSYFKIKPGQFFKYNMKGERGLNGWLSIKIEDGGGGAFDVTIAGKWTEEFSETAKLKPRKTAFDLLYSFKNVAITNAAGGLLDISADIVDNTMLKDGFKWAQGDKSIEVKGGKECAGVKGLLVNYTSKLFGRVQKRTYGVNPDFPLPIYAVIPAANDTWTYELVEKKGI